MTVLLLLAVALALGALVGVLWLARFLGRGLGEGTQASAPRRRLIGEPARDAVLERRSRIGAER